MNRPLVFIDLTGLQMNCIHSSGGANIDVAPTEPRKIANPTSLPYESTTSGTGPPYSPINFSPEEPKNHPAYTGSVGMFISGVYNVVPIYVPSILDGICNACYNREGYTSVIFTEHDSWARTDWAKLVATFISGYAPSPGRIPFSPDSRSNADEAALRKTALLFGAINTGLSAINSSITNIWLRASILSNELNQRRAVIEFGADISLVKSTAGGYYYLLECSNAHDTRTYRRNLARDLPMFGFDYADYKISYARARKSDPYLCYLYKDNNGNWLAYPKKYEGDRIDLVGVQYNCLGFQVGQPYIVRETSFSMRYDRVYAVDEEIKGTIQKILMGWGIYM